MSSETRITATELARSLSDVLSRAKYAGERFIVERGGEPVAELRGITSRSDVTLRDLIATLGDLKLPGDSFGDDLERIRSEQGEVRDPWRS